MKKLKIGLVIIYVLLFKSIYAQKSLYLGGTNAYVSFTNNPQLGLSKFTLECWFKRKGTGITASTGSGGINGIPFITKGRGEQDGNVYDMDYFFGINGSTNTLTADFEEGTQGTTPGLNHPIIGNTAIKMNTWYHAAVTYDGATWKLYLNGQLDGSKTVNQPTQNLSIQYAALGSALNSSGTAEGFFNGNLDEVRVWNSALSQTQINNNLFKKIPAQTGLVARWTLDEGTATAVNDSSGNLVNGNIIGTNYSWSNEIFPLTFNQPTTIDLVYPAADEKCVPTHVDLGVDVLDPEKDQVIVKIWGRLKAKAPKDFTIIPISDTQFYCQQANGGTSEYYKNQTRWIVNHKDSLNIIFACGVGDIVQNGDNGGNDIEWKRADTAISILENPQTTGLPDGLPYIMNVGNHDQTPGGSATGTTTFYNQYFGLNRYKNRSYFGGAYKNSTDNLFQLFSYDRIDFLAISLEYDANADPAVLNWADSLVKAYPNRKVIVVSHWIINSDATFGAQGQAIYNKLKTNPNLWLMLCGHVNPNGEARRTDVYNGIPVNTLLSDYQDRAHGGDGWLRILKVSPENNTIDVKTYSTTLNQFETDANSQFILNDVHIYDGAPFKLLTTDTIKNGQSDIRFNWKDLMADTTYEWYAEVNDGHTNVITPKKQFSTFLPEVDLGDDIETCQSEVELNAGDLSRTYLWSTGEKTNTIQVKNSGKYWVNVKDQFGICTGTDSIHIKFNESPEAPIVQGRSEYCQGDQAEELKAMGTHVEWYSDLDLTIKINEGNTYLPQVESSKSFYIVQYVNGCRSKVKKVDLTVHQLPDVKIENADTVYFIDDNPVTLKGTPSGGIFKGQGVINDTFDPLIAGLGGPYQIIYEYSDENSCSNSDFMNLYVNKKGVGIKSTVKDYFDIKPNPSNGNFNINLNEHIVEVQLTNAIGETEVFYTKNITSKFKGIIFIKVITEDHYYFSKLIIE